MPKKKAKKIEKAEFGEVKLSEQNLAGLSDLFSVWDSSLTSELIDSLAVQFDKESDDNVVDEVQMIMDEMSSLAHDLENEVKSLAHRVKYQWKLKGD